MKLLSIITINYNNLEGLKKTFGSVVNQSWSDFEFIVIDGGSTDGSKEFIEENKGELDHWVSEKDRGVYHALNKGIVLAQGDYLLFLNSGDHLNNSEVLEKNKNNLHSFDLLYFDVEVVDNLKPQIISYPAILRFSYFLSNTICHQAMLFKKELFSRIGLYDEDLEIVADWKFLLLALFKYNCSYKKIDSILTTYYLGGLSSQLNSAKERRKVLNEEFRGFLLDYQELNRIQDLLQSNRYRLLGEAEKSTFGKKVFSVLLRGYYIFFFRKKYRKSSFEN